jgi:hypothetical protein
MNEDTLKLKLCLAQLEVIEAKWQLELSDWRKGVKRYKLRGKRPHRISPNWNLYRRTKHNIKIRINQLRTRLWISQYTTP